MFSKTSLRRLQDVFAIRLLKTSSRRLQDVFKTSSKRLPRRLQDVFARRLAIMSLRRLQGVFKMSWKTKKCYTEDVLKTCWRRLQYVFTKTNVCWEARGPLGYKAFSLRFIFVGQFSKSLKVLCYFQSETIEPLLYKINTCLQKTTICIFIASRANILCKPLIYIFFQFCGWFLRVFSLLFPEAPTSCDKNFLK